ncbi:MAG TPA: ATP-binding protein [Burkholderiaceae bacterium]|nr:ATP-binding protein [Burkholderiaceae bacterium]
MRFLHSPELAAAAGWLALMSGLILLRVQARTRDALHVAAALGCIGIVPSLAAVSGLLPGPVIAESLRSLQCAGLLVGLAAGAGSLALLWRGLQHKRPAAAILLVAMGALVLVICHDLLLALEAIQSVALVPGAAMLAVPALLLVACSDLADALVRHQRLAIDLKALNDNLEQVVAQRTEQLRQKTQDIHALLQHLPVGVLTVTEGRRVHPEYSACLETLLATPDIAGRNVMDLLFSGGQLHPEALAQREAAASSCIGQDRLHFQAHAQLLPGELEKVMPDGSAKALALGWSPICNAQGTVEKLMLCVRDATELKRLQQEADGLRRELALISEIQPVSQEKFQDFIECAVRLLAESHGLVEGAPARRPEVVHHLFRTMHTIKNHARSCGLVHLARHVHAVEQDHDRLRRSSDDAWQQGVLLAQLAALRALLDDYARINDQVLGRKGPGRRGSVVKYLMVEKEQVEQSLQLLADVDLADATAMRGAINQVALSLNLIGADRLDDVLVGILDALPQLAVELGKEPPVVRIEDHGLMIRSQVHGLLKNVFSHLLRNAVDHGLEPAAERLAHGKPVAGRIDLRLALVGGRLRISLRDDGRGLAITQLRRRALAQKLLTPAQARSAHAVAQAIFLPGFSTAEPVTEVSGRGVGLEAVKEFLVKEQGDAEVRFVDTRESADRRAFELVITLPARYAVQPGAQPGRRPAMGASTSAS